MSSVVSFGSWLKQYRVALGITQQELALRIGYATDTIRKLEAGKRRPTVAMLQHLTKTLALPSHEQQMLFHHYAPASPKILSIADNACIPSPFTSLVGRKQSIVAIRALLKQNHVRLLTLSGPPGIGKTRLAIAVAQELSLDWQGMIAYLSLESLTDPSEVLPAIAHAFSLDLADHSPFVLGKYLASQRLLLVLDHFEQVREAISSIEILLQADPELYVLIASRVSTQINGEYEFPVPCLAVPQASEARSQSDLAHNESIELFVTRARSTRNDFEATPEALAVVTSICTLLDGLPLAIELAASLTKYYPLQGILHQLTSHPLHIQEGGSNQNLLTSALHRAIDSSYLLLSEKEQRLFRWLGIFAGDFSETAIQHMTQVWLNYDDAQLQQDLNTLIAHNLIQLSRESSEIRYFHLLRPLRSYAQAQLALCDETKSVAAQHAQYYLAMAEVISTSIQGSMPASWVQRIRREYENYGIALTWARTYNEYEAGLRLSCALFQYWIILGLNEIGRAWLETFIMHTQELSLVRARALYCIGYLSYRLGHFVQARSSVLQSLTDMRSLQNPLGMARAQLLSALIAREQSEYSVAEAALKECIELCIPIHADTCLINAFLSMGATLYHQGKLQEAMTYYEQAEKRNKTLKDPFHEAAIFGNIALVHMTLSHYSQAWEYWEAAMRIFSEQDDLPNKAYTHLNMGTTLALQGKLESALKQAETAQDLLLQIGDQGTLPEVYQLLALIAFHQGKHLEAENFYTSSLEMCQEVGAHQLLTSALHGLGRVAHAREKYEQAHLLLEESYTLAIHHRHLILLAEILETRALVYVSQEQFVQATTYFEQANALRKQLGISVHHVEEHIHLHIKKRVETMR